MSTLNLFGFLKPGARLEGCRIREWKGGGAYGDVYRGVRAGLPVAIKVSKHRQFSLDSSRSDERLLRELVCLLRLEHPHIAKVKGWARTPEERGYLVLEYVDGWTLAEWIQRQRPTFQQVARVFAKLAHALEYMHGRGVRHRDISLSNIMVRKVDGEPVLIDLGAGEYSGGVWADGRAAAAGHHALPLAGGGALLQGAPARPRGALRLPGGGRPLLAGGVSL
ncbi:protein kinase family protein [Corallococcus macrosporus]|uniref:Serine/threonine protein kinase n=1 Tax=Myxococcus fulvus (strain ATCC BAA-855 / HW-1) TaxID=483219 RepID=F8CMF3_MYXFH|nr:protein kinase family protein [Corallococcus macrosporus]AEI64020.1 serine/threonine protein kinase [Corallococcus macrosporus]